MAFTGSSFFSSAAGPDEQLAAAAEPTPGQECVWELQLVSVCVRVFILLSDVNNGILNFHQVGSELAAAVQHFYVEHIPPHVNINQPRRNGRACLLLDVRKREG